MHFLVLEEEEEKEGKIFVLIIFLANLFMSFKSGLLWAIPE